MPIIQVTAPTVSSVAPSSGTTHGSTPVTIAGIDFVATPTVTFDGVPATSVVWVNSTTLTCATPAHVAGAVNIVVTNPDAQTGTLASGYTYTVVVVDVEPDNATVVKGKTLTFTATVTGDANHNVTWAVPGSPANGTISSTGPDTGLYTAPSAGSGLSAWTNVAFVDRIQLVLNTFTGPLTRPLTDPIFANFDPRRDLEICVEGKLIAVRSFAFDVSNNRYLLYMDQAIDLQGVIQIVHHMPSPPFEDATIAKIPGFAILATFDSNTHQVTATSVADPTKSDIVPVAS